MNFRNVARRLAKPALLGAALLAALTVGNVSARADHTPPSDVRAQLTWAQQHSSTPCWAEWVEHTPAVAGEAAKVGDRGPAGWDVVCGR